MSLEEEGEEEEEEEVEEEEEGEVEEEEGVNVKKGILLVGLFASEGEERNSVLALGGLPSLLLLGLVGKEQEGGGEEEHDEELKERMSPMVWCSSSELSVLLLMV